jgi:hypothetical protein
MNRIFSSLGRAAKTIGRVAAGGTIYGLLAVSGGWQPPSVGNPVADSLLSIVWHSVGTGLVAGAALGLGRAINYDPRLDPRNRPLPSE